jgi:magnesium-transporting ATPase (P-type)
MSTVSIYESPFHAFVKSAAILSFQECSQYVDSGSEILELILEIRLSYPPKVSEFSNQALPILSLCSRAFENTERQTEWDDQTNIEIDLTVIARIENEDALRPKVISEIGQSDFVNVAIRIVTGDFFNTTKAIAAQNDICKKMGL